MPLNPYFNHTTQVSEQTLLQDLIDESIQIYGHDTYYIERDTVDLDMILGEDHLAAYTNATPIEMYIKSTESFQGQSEFISKFGLHIEDQASLVVSQRRWALVFGAHLIRPREGDIIWIQMTPDNRYLFEIRFVENKEQLFQLGKLYTYELRCEMMNYTHEKVETALPDIDSAVEKYMVPVETVGANTTPVTVADPVADNDDLSTEKDGVVVTRGQNPRLN